MTYYSAWVGDEVAAAFEVPAWQGGGVGKLPERRGPLWPNAEDAFGAVHERIDSGVYRGAMVDLDAFACVLDKAQLAALVAELAPRSPRHADDWREIAAHVEALPAASYLFVVCAT